MRLIHESLRYLRNVAFSATKNKTTSSFLFNHVTSLIRYFIMVIELSGVQFVFFEFNLELICTSEFFKKLKLHEPLLLIIYMKKFA